MFGLHFTAEYAAQLKEVESHVGSTTGAAGTARGREAAKHLPGEARRIPPFTPSPAKAGYLPAQRLPSDHPFSQPANGRRGWRVRGREQCWKPT
jgi:hypothetical protein